EDRAGELEPTRLSAAGKVIGAVGRSSRLHRASARNVETCLRDIPRGGRAAVLIGHDGEALTLGGKAQERLNEILAVGAMEPCGAQDDVSHVHRCNGLLPGELA